jgi:superfamily I DNA/RNA helicase
VKTAVESIISRGFIEDLPGSRDRLDRLLQLTEAFHDDWDAFLTRTLLGRRGDGINRTSEQVTLMTLHAAKGLEFTVVFIIGCEDGLIPYRLHGSLCSEEEEKRLLYVGMTRAKRYLFLSHADKRMLFGRMQEMKRTSFFDPIEEALIDHVRPDFPGKRKRPEKQMDLF